MRHSHWLYRIIVICLFAFPALAQTITPEEARVQEAASYAAQVGVSLDEAARRLQLQRLAGDLDAALAAEESDTFAGLYIDDRQGYRIVVRSTDRKAEARVLARVAGGPLEGLVEVHPARFSLAGLEKKQKESRGQVQRAGVEHNSDINVFENKVEVYVTDPDKLKARLAANNARLPDGVEVQRVPGLAKFEAAIHGGVGLSTCTSGWNVRHSSGELGTTTAAHCRLAGPQYYQGVLLPMRAYDENGDQDVQWMSTCDLFDTANTFQSGIGLRYVTGTVARTSQAIGQYVCKNGMTTGYKCGWIQTKNFDWGDGFNSTFIRVDSRSTSNDLSSGGDSGGPWFVEDKAYGSHVGTLLSDQYDAIYMAINYVSSLGVQVLTWNPGACAIPPYADFFWERPYWDTRVTFDASYSFDRDGYIVSYFWDFGDGFTTTTTAPYVEHEYWQADEYSVRLVVTDNEGLTGEFYSFVSVCDPGDLCLQ